MLSSQAIHFDIKKSLEELENSNWGEPGYPSHLVTECHRLRRVPLAAFTVENLRILISQSISLQFLIPLAIKELEKDPLVSGDCYEGDLLLTVMKSDPQFWKKRSDLKEQVYEIAKEVADEEIVQQLNIFSKNV